MKSFKKIIIAMMVFLAVLPLAAGGNKESSDTASSGKEVVRVLVPGLSEQRTVDPISGITTLGIPDFEALLNEKIPEYQIEIISIPWDGWIQKTEALVTSGQVDVGFFTNQEAIPGWYMDLTPYLENDPELNFENLDEYFIEPAVFYTTYKSFNYPEASGKVFGIPMTMACNYIIYDTQLFDEWGVPYPDENMSLSELVALSEQMTGTNPVTGKQNYGANLYPTWTEWYALSYDAVKPYTDEGGGMLLSDMDMEEYIEYVKDSPEVLKYFEDLLKLVACSPAGITTGTGSEKFLTQDNDIAIQYDSNKWTGPYMKYVYAGNEDVTGRFKPLLVPSGPEMGMEGFPEFFRFAIAQKAKNPDAAWEVVKTLTTDKEIVDFYLTNYASDKCSCLLDVSGMPTMENEFNKARHDYQMEHLLITDDYWYWRTPLMSVLNDVLSGTVTAEQARQNLYEGMKTWVNNIKMQLGQV